MGKQVAFTLRVDEDLYQRIKAASRRRGRSIKSLVQEAVEHRLVEDEAKELFDAFTEAAQVSDEANVEFAFHAQHEIVKKDDENSSAR